MGDQYHLKYYPASYFPVSGKVSLHQLNAEYNEKLIANVPSYIYFWDRYTFLLTLLRLIK